MTSARKWVLMLVPALLITGVLLAKTLDRIAAPQPLRLLPDSPGVMYFDFQVLRQAGLFNSPIRYAPGYAKFIRHTGFNWERDLNQVAVSLRPTADYDTRAMLVATGNFPATLHAWIRRRAERKWTLQGRRFYQMQGLNRPLIVTWLSRRELALTNGNAPASLQSILRRWGKLLPAAPKLLRGMSWTARRQDFLVAAMQPTAWPSRMLQGKPEANIFQGMRKVRITARRTAHGPRLRLLAEAASPEHARMLAAELTTLRLVMLSSTAPLQASAPPGRAHSKAKRAAAALNGARLHALLTGIVIRQAKNRVNVRLIIPMRDLRAWFTPHTLKQLAPELPKRGS